MASYGMEVVGILPRMMRSSRSIHAATVRTQGSSASLRAKLALGGDAFRDSDPQVLFAAPPFKAVVARL